MTSEHMTNTYLLDRLHGQAVKYGTEYPRSWMAPKSKMHSPSKRLQSGKEINPIQVLQKIFFSFVWGAAFLTQLRTGMPGGPWPLAPPVFGKSVNHIPIRERGRLCPPLYYWHLQIFTRCVTPVI